MLERSGSRAGPPDWTLLKNVWKVRRMRVNTASGSWGSKEACLLKTRALD
jgi:hypothetical protein